MVEKIIINPNKVRGYGNVLNVHSSTDYDLSDCTIESGTDTVNGATETVYTLTPTFSHSYSLAFGSSSYTQTGGSVSVSATLTDGGVAVSGATITFTGGSSTVTATTNSSGVATATVSFTSSGTCTATYGSVSDTASITVQSYLFYDACNSSSGLTDYATGIMYETGSPSTISYDSTENAYKVQTQGKINLIPISPLDNADNFTFEADIKRQTAQLGIGVALSTGNGQGSAFSSSTMGCWLFVNKGFQNLGDTSVSTDTNWSHMSYTKEGLNCTVILTNSSDTSYTKTFTLPSNYSGVNYYVGLVSGASGYCYVKNIKVEAL